MTPNQAKALYRRQIANGETIVIRRFTGTGLSRTKTDATVRARVTSYTEQELVGSIQQGDRRIIVLAEDLEAEGFPTPLTTDDTVLIRGKPAHIEALDDTTRSAGGTIIAYDMRVRG